MPGCCPLLLTDECWEGWYEVLFKSSDINLGLLFYGCRMDSARLLPTRGGTTNELSVAAWWLLFKSNCSLLVARLLPWSAADGCSRCAPPAAAFVTERRDTLWTWWWFPVSFVADGIKWELFYLYRYLSAIIFVLLLLLWWPWLWLWLWWWWVASGDKARSLLLWFATVIFDVGSAGVEPPLPPTIAPPALPLPLLTLLTCCTMSLLCVMRVWITWFCCWDADAA